jgi:FAD-dependent oxidoreductase domain-containing protein 1
MSRPQYQQVVIVGGAIMGSFCAWSLRRLGFAGSITVLERDPSYAFSSTALSAASIRTQFGTPVNVQMSLMGARFLRNLKGIFGAQADAGYQEKGYLVLGARGQAELLLQAMGMQRAQGADIVALRPEEIATRFPGIETGDLDIATFGVRDEGWFDAWGLLGLVRQAAKAWNVTYRVAQADTCVMQGARVTGVRLTDGETVPCDLCILAAGAQSGRFAERMGIALPIVPKKRTVFAFKAPFSLPNFPMLFDTSGLWVRPEGEGFFGGIHPPETDDPDADGDFEPQHSLFEESFWPQLAKRIPAMEAIRLTRAWAGHYEVNTLDHNGVVGPHDTLTNLMFAAGFSGHGVQHAPAVGQAVAEWVTTGAWQSIDMAPLGWARIAAKQPLVETIVY